MWFRYYCGCSCGGNQFQLWWFCQRCSLQIACCFGGRTARSHQLGTKIVVIFLIVPLRSSAHSSARSGRWIGGEEPDGCRGREDAMRVRREPVDRQHFPVESKGRRKKLNEVGYVTAICFGCFLTRCIMMCLSAFNKDADLDVLNHPILNFFYYLLVEIVPLSLVLFILRKLPPKRGIAQYHPIH